MANTESLALYKIKYALSARLKFLCTPVGIIWFTSMDTSREVDSSKWGTAEENLILAGKYAIAAVQFSCYLPLSIVRGRLSMKYSSWSFIAQCLAHALIVSNWTYLLFHQDDLYLLTGHFTETEKISLQGVGLIGQIVCIYFRIYGITNRNATLKFWEKNVGLVEEFQHYFEIEAKLHQIQISLKKAFIIFILAIFTYAGMMLGITFLTQQSMGELKKFGSSSNVVVSLGAIFSSVLIYSHGGQSIWLRFFLKVYSVMFGILESKLRELCNNLNDVHVSTVEIMKPQKISEQLRLDSEFQLCYSLYIRVEEQVKNYNVHFEKQLVTECLMSILNLVTCTFVVMRSGADSTIQLASVLLLAAPVIIIVKHLYELGTDGSQLSNTSKGILDQLHKLNRAGGLNFHQRQDLTLFAMKISANPLQVDAGQYIVINRSLITTVRLPNPVINRFGMINSSFSFFF